MARAYFDITPELLTEILKGFQDGSPRHFSVEQYPLPSDAKVIGCQTYVRHGAQHCIGGRHEVRVEIESQQVIDGTILPPPTISAKPAPGSEKSVPAQTVFTTKDFV